MGWLITLGILVLLAVLPLGIHIRYDEDGALGKLIAGPIRILLFPRPKKEKKEKPKKEPKPKKKKKEEKEKSDSTCCREAQGKEKRWTDYRFSAPCRCGFGLFERFPEKTAGKLS